MKTSNGAKRVIQGFEGYRAYSYKDSGGVWTCGYGHTKGVTSLTRYSLSIAQRKFDEDISEVDSHLELVSERCGGLTQGQWDALSSFIFNVGFTRFSNSTLYRKVSCNKNDPTIKEEFKKWIYCNKKPLPGLIKRRAWESEKYYE